MLGRSQKHSHSGGQHQVRIDQRWQQVRVCRVAEVVHRGKDQLHSEIPRARHFAGADHIEAELDLWPDSAAVHIETQAQLRDDEDWDNPAQHN